MKNILFSFIIPTFKNNTSLFTCVNRILDISYNLNLSYEVIVVDNYSGNEYISVLNEFRNNGSIKIIKNPIIGAHHSRRLGLYNAKGDIIVFVDDDNYLERDYIKFIGDAISDNNGNMIIGCASIEAVPINWDELGFHSHSFACGTLENQKFKNDIPVYWGAGMAMNRSLATSIFKDDLILEGRVDKGNYIMSGEDHEISLRAYFRGAIPHYYKQTGLIHDFNRERLNKIYYDKIQVGFVFAAWTLRLYYARMNKKLMDKHKLSSYVNNLLMASLYFIKSLGSDGAKLIIKEALNYRSYSKKFNIVAKYI